MKRGKRGGKINHYLLISSPISIYLSKIISLKNVSSTSWDGEGRGEREGGKRSWERTEKRKNENAESGSPGGAGGGRGKKNGMKEKLNESAASWVADNGRSLWMISLAGSSRGEAFRCPKPISEL